MSGRRDDMGADRLDDGELDALLGRARADHAPSGDDRARIHAAFDKRLQALGVVLPSTPSAMPQSTATASHSTPPPAAGPAAGSATAGKAAAPAGNLIAGKLLAGSAAAGLAALLAWSALSGPQRTQPQRAAPNAAGVMVAQVPAQVMPSAASAEPARAGAPEVLAPSSEAAHAQAVRTSARAPAQRSPRAAAPVPVPALGAELALLDAARGALDAAEHDRALSLLAAHARRFPNAMLAPERAGLRALALCESGQSARGAKERARFLSEHPGSVLAARVRAACTERNP